MGALRKLFRMVVEQTANDFGFEAGRRGESPRVAFFSEEYGEKYTAGYQAGQKAASAKLMSTVTKNLDDK